MSYIVSLRTRNFLLDIYNALRNYKNMNRFVSGLTPFRPDYPFDTQSRLKVFAIIYTFLNQRDVCSVGCGGICNIANYSFTT